MVGGDPAHTGVAEGPPAPYRTVWSTRIGNPGPVAGPVVLNGTIVVVAHESVVALSAETGAIQWETARDPGPAGPAAIEGQRVVYAEGTGADGIVTAVGLENGEESWSFEAGSPVVGGVTVEDGLAYVGGRDGNVRALNLDSGDEEWSFDASGRVETPPAVAGGLVVVVAEGFKTGRARAHALDVRTGKEEWSFSPEGIALGASAVAVGDDLAVFGLGDLEVHALELGTGRERWSVSSRAPFSARMVPGFGDDVLIGDRVGHLYRMDATSGREAWVFRVTGSFLTGSPVEIGSTAVVGDASGQVSAIDLDSGRLVWKERVGSRPIPGIAVSSGLIFVSSADGTVLALEHDPGGVLLDEASPTTLFVGRAVLNFAVAFASLMIALLTLFTWVGRRRRRQFSEDGVAGADT
jgi:outer membrane protein assembly factor BamB